MARPIVPSDESPPPDPGVTLLSPAWLDESLRLVRAAGSMLGYIPAAEAVRLAAVALHSAEADDPGVPTVTADCRRGLVLSWRRAGRVLHLRFGADGAISCERSVGGRAVGATWEGDPPMQLVRRAIDWIAPGYGAGVGEVELLAEGVVG